MLALMVVIVGVIAAAVSLSRPGSGAGSPTSSSVGASSTSTTAPRQVVVSTLHRVTFVDNCATCSTENFVTGSGTNGRTLLTDVWFPSYGGTVPVSSNSSAPLILLAPGYDLSPVDYQPLINAWVQAGYVVASPLFPDTNPTAVAAVEKVYPVPGMAGDPHPSPETDVANQPRDIAYVLSQLVQDDQTGQVGNLAFLHGLFDASKIGVAGQSDGGVTAAGLYYNSCCQADSKVPVLAVALLSGSPCGSGSTTSCSSGFFQGSWFASDHIPLLVTQGTADACNSPNLSGLLYDLAPASVPKYFLELRAADHLIGYTRGGIYLSVVAQVTTGFFDIYLHHGAETKAQLIAAGKTSESSITSAAGSPALSPVTVNWTYNPGTRLDPCSINFAGPPSGATSSTTAAGTTG